MVPGPAVTALPGHLLEVELLGPWPRLTTVSGMAPKNAHLLIHESCEYLTHKRDFADVTEVSGL